MRVNKTALLVSCLSLFFFAAACEKPEPEKKPAAPTPAVKEAVEMQVEVDEAGGEEEPVEVLEESEEAAPADATEEGSGEEEPQEEADATAPTQELQPSAEPQAQIQEQQPAQEAPPVEQKK